MFLLGAACAAAPLLFLLHLLDRDLVEKEAAVSETLGHLVRAQMELERRNREVR